MSALFHGVAVVLLYVGLPHLQRDNISTDHVVVVELLTVDERRNLPKDVVKEESEDEPKSADISPVESLPVPTPPPPPPSEHNSSASVMKPPPIKPDRTEKLDKKELANEIPSVPNYVRVPVKKPKMPSKPDPFASVLKTVEELEISRKQDSDVKETHPEIPIQDPLEQVLAKADDEFRSDVPLSMTELDNIRYQIQRNWNLPAGGRNVHNMQVALRIRLAPDGNVLDVSVVDQGQVMNDPFFRAMAESAVRAVLKTGQIKNLSPAKYHLWRDMKINFDPREMFG